MAVVDRVVSPAPSPEAPGALEPTRRRLGTSTVATIVTLFLGFGGAIAFYADFIARTSFRYGGRTYFSLFDDAMISMRYAANFAHGHGLVWNPGSHPVEGYTNFLWTLYMAVVHLLPLSIGMTSLAVMITGAVLLLATAVVIGAVARLLAPDSRLVLVLAVTATLFFYPLVYWTLRGMEVGLAALVIATMVWQALLLSRSFSAPRLVGLAILGAVAVLVRDDLVVPTLVVLVYAIAQADRRLRLRVGVTLLGALSATIAAHTAFRLAYYGNALPNTYYVKLQGASLATRLTRGLLAIASTYLLTLFAPCALAAAAIARPWRSRDSRLLLLAGVVASALLYTLYVGGDAWEEFQFADRYLTPSVPLLFILAAIGLRRLLTVATRPRSFMRLLVFGLLGVAIVLAALPGHTMAHWLSDTTWQGSARAIVGRAAVPAGVAVLLAALLFLRKRLPHLATAGVAVAGASLLLVLPNFSLDRQWRFSGAQQASGENFVAQVGLALNRLTRPDDSIALAAVGALPYFADRPGVDLLGLNDVHIAHEPPRTNVFHPGHTKWDYAYSLGTLRPTIVYQLYQDPGNIGHRELQKLGYVEAALVFAPSIVAKDHLLPDIGIYLSPAFAARLRRENLAGSQHGLAWIELISPSESS